MAVRAERGFAGKGVVDRVRSAVDLGKEAPNLPGRLFRLRQLDVSPGGIVAWHCHDERPAHIYIVEGSIVEYASTCRVPIVHKAGEVVTETETETETKGLSHWWQNTGPDHGMSRRAPRGGVDGVSLFDAIFIPCGASCDCSRGDG